MSATHIRHGASGQSEGGHAAPASPHTAEPLRIISGQGALQNLGAELARANISRAVVICGQTLGQHPLTAQLQAAAQGRVVAVLRVVRAHSPLSQIAAAAQDLRALNPDALIAFGGGSAVVSARALAIHLAEAQPIAQLATSRSVSGQMVSPRLMAPKLPLIAIPTTPNTAIVKAGAAVLDDQSNRRLALYDPKTRARLTIIDGDCLAATPTALIQSAGLDSLSLAFEAYLAAGGSAFADAELLHAVRLLRRGLVAADAAGMRETLVFAALLAGRGSEHGAGAATVLGHSLGALHGGENGHIKLALMPHVIRFNAGHLRPDVGDLADALNQSSGPVRQHDPVAVIAQSLVQLGQDLGVPARLRDLGIPRDSLATAAQNGMADWFLKGNPRPITEPLALEQLLHQAW